MRKLVVTENISVDGVIDLAGGWFRPDADSSAQQRTVEREHRDAADAVLLGRNTYRAFESYWPQQTDDTTGVSDYLNRTHKYVLSSTITETSWEHTTVLRGPLADEVRALKASAGRDIVATGSVQLVQSLVDAGLVDEYRLFVYPVVAGTGARLFERVTDAPKLRLAQSVAFDSGVVLCTYSVVS